MSRVTSPESLRTRAEAVFAAYLQRRERDERGDIAALCDAHPELRGELDSIHAAYEFLQRIAPTHFTSLRDRLRTTFGATLELGAAIDPEPAPESGAPRRLFERLREGGARGARYKFVGEVGRGGMGAVLKVWDDELRRTLAMKVVLGRGDERDEAASQVDPRRWGASSRKPRSPGSSVTRESCPCTSSASAPTARCTSRCVWSRARTCARCSSSCATAAKVGRARACSACCSRCAKRWPTRTRRA
jgi:hypothetical protein